MAEKDVRYGRSEKGRARNRRHNASPFRRLMQRERALQRRAAEGYSVYRLVFGPGARRECEEAARGERCGCYSHRIAFGILKPGNDTLTPKQKIAWQATQARARQLMKSARDAALEERINTEFARAEALYSTFRASSDR